MLIFAYSNCLFRIGVLYITGSVGSLATRHSETRSHRWRKKNYGELSFLESDADAVFHRPSDCRDEGLCDHIA